MSSGDGNTGSGEDSESDEGERQAPVSGESTLSSPRYTAENRYATWTESLGFESFDETVNSGDLTESVLSQTMGDAVGLESRSRSRRIARKFSSLEKYDFPPFMSILDINGRPRYDLVKSRESGRLEIEMVPNERPVLVKVIEPNRRFTLSFINGCNQDGQDTDNELKDDSSQDEESKVEGGTWW